MASHKFYVPIGVVSLAAPPASPAVGDTYFDTTVGGLRTWDGVDWVSGGEVEIGPAGTGPTGPTNPALDLWVNLDATPPSSGGGFDQATADTLYVSLSGDTMTGPLTIPVMTVGQPDGSNARVTLNSNAGSPAQFTFRSANVPRWTVAKDTAPESGGNAGSNLFIQPSADDGSGLPTAVSISRATGQVVLTGDLTVHKVSGDALLTVDADAGNAVLVLDASASSSVGFNIGGAPVGYFAASGANLGLYTGTGKLIASGNNTTSTVRMGNTSGPLEAVVPLKLPGDPTDDLHAATKAYVDNATPTLPPETDASGNTSYGDLALNVVTGTNNTALGKEALKSATTGLANTAAGMSALKGLTTGQSNTAFGLQAAMNVTTSNWNTVVGAGSVAGGNTTGNTALGTLNQVNATGDYNASSGYSALRSLTTGQYNTAVGNNAGYAPGGVPANATTTASNQTLVGSGTGQFSTAPAPDLTVVGVNSVGGEYATVVGPNADATGLASVAVGSNASATGFSSVALGSNSYTTGDYQVVLGTDTHKVVVPGTGIHTFAGPIALPADPALDLHAATKKYVDTKWTMWTGTQAEYDAIPAKNATTLYVVV